MRAPAAWSLVSTESVAIVRGDRGWRVQLPAHGSAAWRSRANGDKANIHRRTSQ